MLDDTTKDRIKSEITLDLRRIERIVASHSGEREMAWIERGKKLGIPFARVWINSIDGPRVLGWATNDDGTWALLNALERVRDEAATRAAKLEELEEP